jgi:tetratricopeptide (TPR) repeat protein
MSVWLLLALAASPTHSEAGFPGQAPPRVSPSVSANIPKQELEKESQVKSLLGLGTTDYKGGMYEKAVGELQQALDLSSTLNGADQENARFLYTTEALEYLGNSYLELKRYQDAETTYQRWITFAEQAEPFESSTATAFVLLASVHGNRSEWDKAMQDLAQGIALLDRCIDHFKKSDEYDSQDVVANDVRRQKAKLLAYLGNLYANRGETGQALSSYQAALEICQKFRASKAVRAQVVGNALQVAMATGQSDQAALWQSRQKALEEEP